jgi:hypothetical protein
LCGRPFQHRFGFRPRHEYARTDVHGHRTERRRSDDVLKRLSADALGDETVVRLVEVRPRVEECQSPALDTGGVGGE